LEGQKTVNNLARFLTTFDFDREYLRNGSTNRKSEKQMISYNPTYVVKKDRELYLFNIKIVHWVYFGAQTKKLLTHPSGHFSGDYNFGP